MAYSPGRLVDGTPLAKVMGPWDRTRATILGTIPRCPRISRSDGPIPTSHIQGRWSYSSIRLSDSAQ
jgi:hypothetical protein